MHAGILSTYNMAGVLALGRYKRDQWVRCEKKRQAGIDAQVRDNQYRAWLEVMKLAGYTQAGDLFHHADCGEYVDVPDKHDLDCVANFRDRQSADMKSVTDAFRKAIKGELCLVSIVEAEVAKIADRHQPIRLDKVIRL